MFRYIPPVGNFRLPAGKASAHDHMKLVKLFGFGNSSYLYAYPQVGTIDTTFEVNSIKRNNYLVLALLSKKGTFCHLWLRDKNSPTSGRKISRRKIPLAIVLKIDGVVDFPHKLGKSFWMKSSLASQLVATRRQRGCKFAIPLLIVGFEGYGQKCPILVIGRKSALSPKLDFLKKENIPIMNPDKNVQVRYCLFLSES